MQVHFWGYFAWHRMNLLTERPRVLSMSFGKKHAGSSFDLRWYCMHSQHLPFLGQGSQVQLQKARIVVTSPVGGDCCVCRAGMVMVKQADPPCRDDVRGFFDKGVDAGQDIKYFKKNLKNWVISCLSMNSNAVNAVRAFQNCEGWATTRACPVPIAGR